MLSLKDMHDAIDRNKVRREKPGGPSGYLVIERYDDSDFALPSAAFEDEATAQTFARDEMTVRGEDADNWETSFLILPVRIVPAG